MALVAVPLLHVTVLPGHAQVKLSARQRLRQIFMVSGVESFGVVIGGIAGLLIVNVLQKDPYAVSIFMVACTTLLIGVTDLRLAHCCVPVVGQRGTEVPWAVGSCHPIFSQALTAAFRRARAHRALPLARTRMDRHGLLGSLAGALVRWCAGRGAGAAERALCQNGDPDPGPYLCDQRCGLCRADSGAADDPLLDGWADGSHRAASLVALLYARKFRT